MENKEQFSIKKFTLNHEKRYISRMELFNLLANYEEKKFQLELFEVSKVFSPSDLCFFYKVKNKEVIFQFYKKRKAFNFQNGVFFYDLSEESENFIFDLNDDPIIGIETTLKEFEVAIYFKSITPPISQGLTQHL